MNICTFTGRLTKDPELKSTPSGVSYVRFTLAVERGYGTDNTDFLRFVIWGEPAKRAVDWLSKGDLIGVKNSRAQVSEFRDQKTGNTVRVTEFHTNEFLEFLNIKKRKKRRRLRHVTRNLIPHRRLRLPLSPLWKARITTWCMKIFRTHRRTAMTTKIFS